MAAPRVLVIDDEAAIQLLFQVLLSRAGCEVDQAADGDSGLEKLATGTYEAVILDLMRPGHGGTALLERLSRVRPELLQRVIVTTSGDPRMLSPVERSRIHAVFRKPFDIDEFVAAVLRCTRGEH